MPSQRCRRRTRGSGCSAGCGHGRASVAADIAGLGGDAFRSALYIEVPQLAPIRKALTGWPRVVPERTTLHGAREIIVRDPAGNVVLFSSRDPPTWRSDRGGARSWPATGRRRDRSA